MGGYYVQDLERIVGPVLVWDFCVLQVQGSSYGGTVFSGGLSLKVPAFM